MNTYSENLQHAVDATLSALTTEQEKLSSENTTAQLNLYHAQGAEIVARDKLADTQKKMQFYQHVNAQGVVNDNQAMNLLTSTTDANTKIATSVTNMATAASNVQIASNAIALLASDIGAALNVASASLYGTDLYERICDANAFINETANDAKRTSVSSMEATGNTSEIISADVMQEATTVKTKIEDLLKVTEAEYKKLADLEVAENTKVGETSKAERGAEGALKDAERAVKAINRSYTNAAQQLNYNLMVTVDSSTRVTLKFVALADKIFQYKPANEVKIPPNTANYYLALVSADKKTLLTTAQAELLFSQTQQQTSAASNNVTVSSAFTHVAPGSTNVTLAYKPKGQGGSVDIYGEPIKPGNDYVAFLYIELPLAYKQYVANFSDLLSSPSQSFTLATKLPLAQAPQGDPCHKDDVSQIVKNVYFQADNISIPTSQGEQAELQYRCIFIKKNNGGKLAFYPKVDSDEDTYTAPEIEKKISIIFNTEIALNTAPSNYTVAHLDKATGSSVSASKSSGDNGSDTDGSDEGGNAGKTTPMQNLHGLSKYHVPIAIDTTDNFGEPIEKGTEYQPIILSVIDGDQHISKQYIAGISFALAPITLIPDPDKQTA